jgi:AcrR family transcriptional regulator
MDTVAADPTFERILAAARREFDAGHTPSLATVAAAAGVSRATVHRHVGSRAGLLRLLEIEPDPATGRRVLAAAAEVIGAVGLARASMDDIAERAAVSRATVYRLYPGKAALLRELIRAYSPLDAVVEALDAHAGGPPAEVMPALALAALRSVGPRVGVLRTVFTEMTGAGPETEAAVRDALGGVVSRLGGYLAGEMAAGRLRPMHPLLAVQSFGGPILLHILSRPVAERVLGLDLDAEAAVVELAQLWLRGMRP